jgi:outer membrane receptor for Fe3+-dicitrate
MYSKFTLALGTALAAIVLCCFVESSLGQDALTAPVAEGDSDDVDGETDGKDDKSRQRRSHKSGGSVNTHNAPWANANENQSLAVTSIAETTEAEAVVVTGGWFDTYPVPYPALPPVEGTRINSGKKTSFVKPKEFPAFADNDYREVMATMPGIVVSEEPQSPIINFGYRGLNSQRSEFTQVLKEGVSIKNEQFGFPESHYTPILDAVERIEVIRAGAALQFGPHPVGPSILS